MTLETLVQGIMESARELTDAEINQIAAEAAAKHGADADGVKLLLLSGTERFRAAMFEATCKQATP